MAKTPNIFSERLFDVEHAISIFAYSYVTLPAHEIYNTELLREHAEIIENCHIYLVGYAPKIELTGAEQRDRKLITSFLIAGVNQELEWDLPDGHNFKTDGNLFWVERPDGGRTFPNLESCFFRLHAKSPMQFRVQYVGQAFGENGERNAIERLTKHETLQKIALQPKPEKHEIQVLLVQIQPNNHMMTVFNPWAAEKDDDGSRMKNALDSLYETSEAQQVSLYEAALIRYFQPKFNKIFKNSFPSTNLAVLKQCYEKDMAAIIAEFCVDEIPYYLSSESVDAMHYHIAGYNIHGKKDRNIFFGFESGSITNIASIKA